MTAQVIHGECLEVLRDMADSSVDSIVTDPPYGLSFMGKRWDYDVPPVEVWSECLRVLKPGGYLLAFAGTRTQHRMAVRIEDAGFEIRDMIAWVYGSGFPKSLDVSKAVDRAAGARRVLTRPGVVARDGEVFSNWDTGSSETRPRYDLPATEMGAQWQGWGTALKPSIETITMAIKPCTDIQERDIILSNLIRLEARLWLLSSASAAEKNSTSNPSEYGEACAIAQWGADEITSTRAALCDQMDTSLFELATNTSLNIVSSWRRTLVESWSDGNTSTIETKSSTTTDLRTLKFSLSQITPESIIKACSLPGGFSANATTAESHFNASLSLLQSIRTLSATEPAISQAQHEHLGAGVKPNLDPCIMARKPLIGTVAENVLAHGTGALNIDGCRADGGERPLVISDRRLKNNTYSAGLSGSKCDGTTTSGRWPANLIHDGSEEVLAAFPQAPGQSGAVTGNEPSSKTNAVYGQFNGRPATTPRGDAGSAARFFYCAKASRKDRNEGCEHMQAKPLHWSSGSQNPGSFQSEGTDKSSQNNHPTVKPTDLMRYLCRLVTPPGGVVLDPFSGSGSTGKAAVLEGFDFIGIEREAQYVEIARARISAVSAQKSLFA